MSKTKGEWVPVGIACPTAPAAKALRAILRECVALTVLARCGRERVTEAEVVALSLRAYRDSLVVEHPKLAAVVKGVA